MRRLPQHCPLNILQTICLIITKLGKLVAMHSTMENSLYSCNPFEFGTGGRRICFSNISCFSKDTFKKLLAKSKWKWSVVCVRFQLSKLFLNIHKGFFLITNSRMNSFFGFSRLDVAFTAVPSTSTSYGSGLVNTNIGNDFNRSNYRFRAPSTGLYIFCWSIALHVNYIGNTNLVINGSTFHMVHCQKTFQHCGSTVTVWLSKNNQVLITSAYSSIYVYATYLSFSGWKLHWICC